MFRQAIALIASALALLPLRVNAASQTYAIEPSHTVVSFEVRNMGMAKQRGVFDQVAGIVMLDPQLAAGSIEIVVNARSVATSNAVTQAFLRGTSFLDVEQYSEITYKAVRVVFAGDKPIRIEGKLTLLGVTQDVPLVVSGYQCAEHSGAATGCVLDAAASFRRSRFGMNHYLALVSDTVRLAIHGVISPGQY
jgi:polyisoprenoid-binding protein YceI